VAKSTKDRDRRAIVEEMRKKQQAAERKRNLIVFAICFAIGAGIIGVAAKEYIDARSAESRDLSDIGVAKSAAACQPIEKKNAEGNQEHVASGVHIDYDAAPPAYGKHDGNYLRGAEIKNIYFAEDRPPVERLVHSLEHGYTILWYDETIADDSAAMKDVKAIADRYPVGDHVIVAPWLKDDGDAFPDGTHLSLTHWTGPDNQQGVWEYCGKVSGSVVQSFVDDYPNTDAPEPNGI